MANVEGVKTVAIGLQGGGSHSAFAWGAVFVKGVVRCLIRLRL
jgi:hypothetical protein